MKRQKRPSLTGEICMRCCSGRLVAKHGREYFRQGDALVVIEDVPAWVCTKCGERYHRADVFKKMREIAAHSSLLKRHIKVSVARYRPDKAA